MAGYTSAGSLISIAQTSAAGTNAPSSTFLTEVGPGAGAGDPIAFDASVDVLFVCRELGDWGFDRQGHAGPVTALLCYRDILISIGGDGRIRSWVAVDGTPLHDVENAHDGHPILDIGLAEERYVLARRARSGRAGNHPRGVSHLRSRLG